jgi:hypothetical protein
MIRIAGCTLCLLLGTKMGDFLGWTCWNIHVRTLCICNHTLDVEMKEMAFRLIILFASGLGDGTCANGRLCN